MTTTITEKEILLAEKDDQLSKLRVRKERYEALLRLFKNPDFKLLIQEGYLTAELKSLTNDLVSAITEGNTDRITRSIHGVGSFRQYLSKVEDEGKEASLDYQHYLNEYNRILTETDEDESDA